MKYFTCLLLLFSISAGFSQFIVPPVVSSSNVNVPVLTQSEIDYIQSPAEGYVVINKTTNCINYYINQTWFQQCGSCLPETAPYTIDSFVQKGTNGLLYFSKSSNDTLHLRFGEAVVSIFEQTSPAAIKLPIDEDTLKLRTYVSNRCYTEQRTNQYFFRLRKNNNSAPYKLTVSNKEIIVRKIGNTIWMCDDWLQSNKSSNLSTILVAYSSGMCPVGWNVPSKKDWGDLMEQYAVSISEVFEKPEATNMSIGIKTLGAYSVDEKRIVGEQSMGSYWAEDRASNGNQSLINITDSGYMFVAEKAEKARLNLRCVKHE